ncbi:MAG: diaminopimelate epimerase [Bacteroidales bacterium]|nr:diaminopimelate epimerase [Bacteroidales bacterium]
MKGVKLYKMSGAGNDFVVLDGRGVDVSGFRQPERIRELCKEFRTDGLMILLEGDEDFRMEFYNPDGSGGMMCGNGGRCIVAFADWLGIAPADGRIYHFLAPDGLHCAEILSKTEKGWMVKLEMIDVEGISEVLGGYFLNTGTRHFVKFVEDVDAVDVATEGKELRWNEAFAPEGANINFVQRMPDGTLKIRTFEKGVEGETLACGTGITAAALATWFAYGDGERAGLCPEKRGPIPAFPVAHETIRLQARRGDILTVDFIPDGSAKFHDIHLTGPAEFV